MKTLIIGFLRIMQILSAITGMFLMFLENDDFHKQMMSLGIGFVLFVIGCVPAIIESIISYQEEQDGYIR